MRACCQWCEQFAGEANWIKLNQAELIWTGMTWPELKRILQPDRTHGSLRIWEKKCSGREKLWRTTHENLLCLLFWGIFHAILPVFSHLHYVVWHGLNLYGFWHCAMSAFICVLSSFYHKHNEKFTLETCSATVHFWRRVGNNNGYVPLTPEGIILK